MSAPLRDAARILRALGQSDPAKAATILAAATPEDKLDLWRTWQLYARPSQLRPFDCKPLWVRQCGRGEGKTRSAAEETLDMMEDWGALFRGALMSKNIGEVIKVMIKGESGLIACAERRGYKIDYRSNESCVYHPSGAKLDMLTAEKPDGPRGGNYNWIWADEIAAWRPSTAVEAFDNLILAWRLAAPGGKRGIVTTTPKPNAIMQSLHFGKHKNLATITFGRTADNRHNLDADTYESYVEIYQGTRLGQQELEGILLSGLGTIVDQDTIHQFRVREVTELRRTVVSLDPSITAKDTSDEAGIVVVGIDDAHKPDAYVLGDHSMGSATFAMWARQSVLCFLYYDADCVVAEVNQGGGGIEEAIQIAAEQLSQELDREIVVPVRSVWARESKRARAEPVGALYERGRIHHVGHFGQLERELSTWIPGAASPNRMDALVHGVTHLVLGDKPNVGPIGAYYAD